MKTIYFIRHAESEGNARGILTGQLDLPLTPAGETAARAASKHWQRINPEIVYCSALKRTQQTARLLFPNAALRIDSRLNERHFGAWHGRAKSELRRLHPYAFLDNGRLTPEFTPPSGEPYAQLLRRLQIFLEDATAAPEHTMACITHAGILFALCAKREAIPQNPGTTMKFECLSSLRVHITSDLLHTEKAAGMDLCKVLREPQRGLCACYFEYDSEREPNR